jgi:Domain of unknown function (DUF397)
MPARPDRYPAATWRKSSASQGATECVEISVHRWLVLVRDSKNANGVTLEIPPGSWRELMRRIRNGDLGVG